RRPCQFGRRRLAPPPPLSQRRGAARLRPTGHAIAPVCSCAGRSSASLLGLQPNYQPSILASGSGSVHAIAASCLTNEMNVLLILSWGASRALLRPRLV